MNKSNKKSDRAMFIILKTFVLTILCVLALTDAKQTAKAEQEDVRNDHYTFQLSDKVIRKKVTFKNRYGITLAAIYIYPKIRQVIHIQRLQFPAPLAL